MEPWLIGELPSEAEAAVRLGWLPQVGDPVWVAVRVGPSFTVGTIEVYAPGIFRIDRPDWVEIDMVEGDKLRPIGYPAASRNDAGRMKGVWPRVPGPLACEVSMKRLGWEPKLGSTVWYQREREGEWIEGVVTYIRGGEIEHWNQLRGNLAGVMVCPVRGRLGHSDIWVNDVWPRTGHDPRLRGRWKLVERTPTWVPS